MELAGKSIGFALTGSFCMLAHVIPQIGKLKEANADIYPIISSAVASTDTRFGKASEIRALIENISGNKVITTISEAEPIGPKKLLDALVIAPCTGNTLAKLALGVTDGAVTMAAKAHLRNGRPLIIGLSTNDGLGNSAKNLGVLLNTRNIYFIPFGQDDPETKCNSLVADMSQTVRTVIDSLEHRQTQPVLR